MTAAPSIDICICTFRRPHLAQTLASIAAMQPVAANVRVIVSDNDDSPSARALVEAIAGSFPFPLRYLHSPASNISIARNACLDAASGDYVAFVDDDEVVDPNWLAALLRVASATGAGAVLGPVKAIYDGNAPQWMATGDFHSTHPVEVNGRILTGYTCNVLIRWTEPASRLRFDLALGRSGGEDTQFFYRLSDLGVDIGFAPDAWVYEPVPTSRAQMGWLMRRRLRAGQTHGARLRDRGPVGIAVSTALASAKVAYCLAMASLTSMSPVRWRQNFLRAVMHAGVVSSLFGGRQASHYGGSE